MLIPVAIYQLSRRAPERVRRLLRAAARRQLPPGYDLDTALHAPLQPVGPAALRGPGRRPVRGHRAGPPTMVTDTIDRSPRPASGWPPGGDLDADIIVTATGLNLLAARRDGLTVDGAAVVDRPRRVAYKGMMLSGVPNFALTHRLHQRVLDAEGRPGRALRLPAAGHMDRTGSTRRHAAAAGRPARAAADRPAVRLRPARRWTRCPRQGPAATVAAPPELPRGRAACVRHDRRSTDAVESPNGVIVPPTSSPAGPQWSPGRRAGSARRWRYELARRAAATWCCSTATRSGWPRWPRRSGADRPGSSTSSRPRRPRRRRGGPRRSGAAHPRAAAAGQQRRRGASAAGSTRSRWTSSSG